jgi:hypothetical protein
VRTLAVVRNIFTPAVVVGQLTVSETAVNMD